MSATSASPMSSSCRSTSIRSTAHGAISRPACMRRPAGSARRRISPRWSMPAIAKASPCCWTGCPGISPTIRTASANFDGTALYEHANPLQGRHLDWGTLIYNYGRTEVVNFLVSNALFWLERYARRRPARRCGRLHALSRLQPARRRLDPEQVWRPRESRGDRFPAPLQYRSVRANFRRRPRRRKNRPPGRRCRGRSNMAGSASATNGTWAGCTTR